MQNYVVQLFDRRRRKWRVTTLVCASDDAAIDRAAALDHRNALEVWQGERYVWGFERPLAVA